MKNNYLNISRAIAWKLFFSTWIIGAVISGMGVLQYFWPSLIPVQRLDIKFIQFFLIISLIILLVMSIFKINTWVATIFAGLFLIILANAILPLLVVFWLIASSILMGRFILRILGIDEDRLIINFLIGVGIFGTIVGLLAHFSISYPGLYGIVLASSFWFERRLIRKVIDSTFLIFKTNKSNVRFAIDPVQILIGTLAIVYVAVGLMPELGYDALAVHLFIPAHISFQHKWGFSVQNYIWAVMPALGDWIYSISYMLGGETATRLLNVSFIFALSILIRNLVLWLGGSARGAAWAVLIFLSTPLTFTEGSSLYIESIWASFVVGGVLLVLNGLGDKKNTSNEFIKAGFLLGFSMAAKAGTFTLFPGLIIVMGFCYKLIKKQCSLFAFVLSIILLISLGSIPYITAYILTENPVFPLFNKIFKSQYFLTNVNFSNPSYNSGLSWETIYTVTFQTGKYLEATAGAAGFQWLLLFMPSVILVIFTIWKKGIYLLIISIIGVYVTFQSQSYLRYIFPSVVFFIALIGFAISYFEFESKFKKNLVLITSYFVILANLIFLNTGNGFYADFPISTIFDSGKRLAYLEGRLPLRNAVEVINRINLERAPVLIFGEPLAAGIASDVLYPNWYNWKVQREVSKITNEEEAIQFILKNKVKFIVIDSAWNGFGCCDGVFEKISLIEKVSNKVTDVGAVKIYKVNDKKGYGPEKLKNSNFESIEGWRLGAEAIYSKPDKTIQVNESSPAVQLVKVEPGVNYLNTAVIKCTDPLAEARLQINWLDADGKMISAASKKVACTNKWAEFVMESKSPINSVAAEVYSSGNNTRKVSFKMNSLK